MNLAMVNGTSLSNYSSIVELHIGSSFLGIGTPGIEISILKVQSCGVHLQAVCWDTDVLIDCLFSLF